MNKLQSLFFSFILGMKRFMWMDEIWDCTSFDIFKDMGQVSFGLTYLNET